MHEILPHLFCKLFYEVAFMLVLIEVTVGDRPSKHVQIDITSRAVIRMWIQEGKLFSKK